MSLQKMPITDARLELFPEMKLAYLIITDLSNFQTLDTIELVYSRDIKDFEPQLLLYGYRFLEKNDFTSVDNYLETYKLESI